MWAPRVLAICDGAAPCMSGENCILLMYLHCSLKRGTNSSQLQSYTNANITAISDHASSHYIIPQKAIRAPHLSTVASRCKCACHSCLCWLRVPVAVKAACNPAWVAAACTCGTTAASAFHSGPQSNLSRSSLTRYKVCPLA